MCSEGATRGRTGLNSLGYVIQHADLIRLFLMYTIDLKWTDVCDRMNIITIL